MSAGDAAPALRRLGSGLRRAAGFVLDTVLPPLCLTCRGPVLAAGAQCEACARQVTPIGAGACDRCGVPLGDGLLATEAEGGALLCPTCVEDPPEVDSARAAFVYDEGGRRLVLPLKYARRTDLARWLAGRMAAAAPGLLARAELIVPVPLHWRRLVRRGYNQAGLLALHLGRRSGLPVLPTALRRVRATQPLGEKGAAARAETVAGAFAVAPRAAARLAGRRVLLVDDVLTSGATVSACARALREAGAASVDAIAAARTPHPAIRAIESEPRWP